MFNRLDAIHKINCKGEAYLLQKANILNEYTWVGTHTSCLGWLLKESTGMPCTTEDHYTICSQLPNHIQQKTKVYFNTYMLEEMR